MIGPAARASLMMVVAIASHGCLKAALFSCTSSAQCTQGAVQGVCETVGFCSFPDPTCPEGRRFGDLSGSAANVCVGSLPIDAAVDTTDAPTFSVGGTVTGLSGTLVLANNGNDSVTVTVDGTFTFPMRLLGGQAYAVSVTTPPAGQHVRLSNQSGGVGNTDVTDVSVTCAPLSTDFGIQCATDSYCNSPDICCISNGASTGSCVSSASCVGMSKASIACDDAADCSALGASAVCCAHIKMGLKDAVCESQPSSCVPTGGGSVELFCDPNAVTPCPTPQTCTGTPSVATPGYEICQ